MKVALTLLSALLLLSTLLLLGFIPASANDAVPAPSYFPGEYWVYAAVDERDTPLTAYSGFENGEYKMEVSEDGKLDLEPRFASIMPSLYEGTTTASGIEWYRFPLKVGETWPVKRNTSQGWAYGTATVVAKESVKVHAGTFETYKVVIPDLTANSAYGYMSYEYWYAPVVKTAIKVVYQQHRADNSVTVTRSAELVSHNVR